MTLSTLYVRALVDSVEQRGVSREHFLRAAGFDVQRLEDVDDRVTCEEYDALVARALDVHEQLGLSMGEAVSPAPYNLTAHLVAHAPTLRSAIDCLQKYHRLLNDRPAYDFVVDGRTAALIFDVGEGQLRCRRFHAEFTMACLYRMVWFFGRDTKPESVDFEHEAPRYASEYERIFEGAHRFGRPSTRVVFASDILDVPQLHQDVEFYSLLQVQAQRRIQRLVSGTSYTDRVFEYLLERAAPGERDMNAAAREVGVSVRSLRRRLHEEGASYNDILEKALAARAKRFLCDEGRSIDDAAYTLGFSDKSAFYRAFKRWTGTTPKQYRQQQHG